MTATNTTKDAWRIIISFLTPKDYFNLSLVSKSLNSKARESQDILVKQFHYGIIENQDTLLGSMYQNTSYLPLLRFQITKNIQNFGLYRSYELSKLQFKEVMTNFTNPNIATEILQKTIDALQAPSLRAPSLKRESETLETFSLFQDHLNDVIVNSDPESQYSELIGGEDINGFIFPEKESLRAISEEHKEALLAARWYLKSEKFPSLNQKENNSDFDTIPFSRMNGKLSQIITKNASNENTSIHRLPQFLGLYFAIDEIFTSFCIVISNYLAAIEDPFLFVAEYTTKWKNYTMSMQTIGSVLREFSKVMNEVYNSEFKGLPQFPKFSIWRMMTKIWHKEVFSTLKKKMILNFGTIFESYLDNFAKTLQKINSSELCSYVEGIPRELLTAPEFEIVAVISEFWQSVIDMSFHEGTLCTLTFADMSQISPIADLWSSLNELILRRCNAVIETTQVKPNLKFELIMEYMNLIESAIPHKYFPEVHQTLLNSLQNILLNFTSSSEDVRAESTSQLFEEDNIKSFLNFNYTEAIEFRYPSIYKHIKYCKSMQQKLEEVKRSRESQRTKYQDYIQNYESQQLFMEYGNKTDLKALENLYTVNIN